MKRIQYKIVTILTLALLMASLGQLVAATKTTSLLWGENGELWDSRGRLPDYSYAGYGGGHAVKPTFSNIIDVTEHGALPNDNKSDVAAISAIIKTAPDNSVIYFPKGRYVIDTWLKIERSNIILRGVGDGTDGTVFYMPKSATDLSGSFNGSFATGDKGQIIEFFGRYNSKITKITEEALRCDKVIEVEDASKLKQGDIIEINADGDNSVNGELWYEYFNNQTQDFPTPVASWLSANGGNMFHTIEKIEGKLVTLREPLRLRLKPSWNMFVYKRNSALQNVGMEDIRIDVIEKVHAEHLKEPGYNPIGFTSCYNFWCKNLTILNADNPIFLRSSAYGEVEDVVIDGREGHHGFSFAYSSNNVISNIDIRTTTPFTHAVTFIHKANGNVLRNIKGVNTITLDFHRNAPFSNLICDVRSDWTHQSSGSTNAGPHAGARNVYWGLQGKSTSLFWGKGWKNEWGYYQCTVVSGLEISEIMTEDREWYENVPDLKEKDLYAIQKTYHEQFKPELIFSEGDYGDRSKWTERDDTRWKVQELDGETYYSLFAKALPPVTTGKLPEYSVCITPPKEVYEVEVNMKYISHSINRRESDLVLLCAYVDDDNYIFGRVSTSKDKSGVFSVNKGVVTKIAGSPSAFRANDIVMLKLGVEHKNITLTMNNVLVAKAENVANIPMGKVGVGSSSNGVLLQDMKVNDKITSSLNDAHSTENVSIYPNPVSSLLTIDAKSDVMSYALIDMSGNVLIAGNEPTVDMSNYNEGVYFLRLKINNKNQIIKVVKTVN